MATTKIKDPKTGKTVGYYYRGYELKCHGYYAPDKCIWWEATNVSTGEADFRAKTKKHLITQIDQHT